MTLNSDEREILRRVAASPEPVAATDFFYEIHPPEKEWSRRQVGLYEALVRLKKLNLLRIVHPANGERPDLVEATPEAAVVLG
ncbi:hypothetical protein [Streptomyces alfalfae]